MRKTTFAGLTVLDAGESLAEDSGAFIGRDRDTIDHLLQVGAKTHRHSGLDGLLSPDIAPGAVITASAGTLAPDLAISVGYTLEDVDGGETLISPVTVVTTQPPLDGPPAAPSASAAYDGGGLEVDTYFYAQTFSDGAGGETALGPAVSVERQPGYASGQVKLSNLAFGVVAAGAAGWRLYRATGGGPFCLLATGGPVSNTFTDDGKQAIDCDVHPPPGDENTTLGVSTLLVTLPSTGLGSAAVINVYASVTGDFGGGSFLGQYPVASAGQVVPFSTLNLSPASPPSVNLSIGTAHQIDPDTELIDWHWKRPVADVGSLPGGATEGDVRMVQSFVTPTAYVFHDGSWQPWQAGGSGSTGPWVKMAPINSWVGTVSPDWPPSYRVAGDRVELAGGVASGADGVAIFNFPVGARPAARVKLGVGEGKANAGITLEVNSAGDLISDVSNSSGIIYLSGLSFPLSAPPS